MIRRYEKYILLSLIIFAFPAFSKENNIITLNLPDRENGKPGATIAVDIFTPQTGVIQADLLVLPGWNFSRNRWQKETDLLKLCEKKKYRCIFPEMGITLYESAYFPETKLKWSYMAGGEWIKKIFLPEMQKKGILKNKNKNFILGLSTGGRGVALLNLQNPGLFKAGACLSGDFNQINMPADNLMKSLYGEFDKFKERWQNIDNPQTEVTRGNWHMPVYIGHGKKDAVVPFSQSKNFYESLRLNNASFKIVFSQPASAGHNFIFWNSELNSVFSFFESIM